VLRGVCRFLLFCCWCVWSP